MLSERSVHRRAVRAPRVPSCMRTQWRAGERGSDVWGADAAPGPPTSTSTASVGSIQTARPRGRMALVDRGRQAANLTDRASLRAHGHRQCGAAGLAHDLGHPPFGHIAEEELQTCARTQSFRIITRLATRDGSGLAPDALDAQRDPEVSEAQQQMGRIRQRWRGVRRRAHPPWARGANA